MRDEYPQCPIEILGTTQAIEVKSRRFLAAFLLSAKPQDTPVTNPGEERFSTSGVNN